MTEDILHFLSSLPGVVDTAPVRPEDIPGIRTAEEADQEKQIVPLRKPGIHALLVRESLFVILKDSSFRPPPCPTIYLVEERGDDRIPPDQSIQILGETYRVIGEEVIGEETSYAERHMFFGSDFVLFPERRMGRRHVPAFLVIPPVPFPELEEVKGCFGIDSIMSVSPSTRADEYLRGALGFPMLPSCATILVGWDSTAGNPR
jgi:hypothetical protein